MKKGFTLAEVLITLGIIGIVAALTLPQAITNIEQQDTETRLEKSYATISNAFKMAEAEYGPFETWFTTGQTAETVFNRFKPYMKFAFEPKVPGNMPTGPGSGITYNGVYFKFPDGTCGIFRSNGFKTTWGDNAYFWHIYTKCERKMVAGRTSFEFSVMNSKKLNIRCTNGISSDKCRPYDSYLASCSRDNSQYGWKEYGCFFNAARNGWKFTNDYQYGSRTQKESNINNDHYSKMPGWH